ncbi:cobalamin biosynthesis protein CobD/CbiB [Alteromonas ponticola]|uniref:Adenosylcobinamide-phosphate synthase n=1 Tax=Alteromonas ponticola TaxID=2720613 RepID=A0ABX1QZT8_9ALTE|nr:cobalamin biosynthesis protein [Alteromonas ponticola]NMH59748.1 adenosylcobinamide-phosphate synthase [Alteromonas ponticola]
MEALFTDSVLGTLAILWLVVVLDFIWRWPSAYHPLTLLRLMASSMAKKVLPAKQDPAMQHYISGALGPVVIITPFAVLLGLLVYIAEYPLFFEAVLMLALVDFNHIRFQYKRVVAAVGKNKKVLTRETLTPIVYRDCEKLTDIGIAKAAIESLVLRFCYQYWGVLFWFLLAGPVTALVYRMLLTINWEWHWRKPGYLRFSQPVHNLTKAMRAIPAFIASLALILVTHPIKSFTAMINAKARDQSSLILAVIGGGHDIKLGGPAFYHGQKYRYPRVGGQRDVRYSDMIYCQRAITRASLLLATLSTLLLLALWESPRVPGLY